MSVWNIFQREQKAERNALLGRHHTEIIELRRQHTQQHERLIARHQRELNDLNSRQELEREARKTATKRKRSTEDQDHCAKRCRDTDLLQPLPLLQPRVNLFQSPAFIAPLPKPRETNTRRDQINVMETQRRESEKTANRLIRKAIRSGGRPRLSRSPSPSPSPRAAATAAAAAATEAASEATAVDVEQVAPTPAIRPRGFARLWGLPSILEDEEPEIVELDHEKDEPEVGELTIDLANFEGDEDDDYNYDNDGEENDESELPDLDLEQQPPAQQQNAAQDAEKGIELVSEDDLMAMLKSGFFD